MKIIHADSGPRDSNKNVTL